MGNGSGTEEYEGYGDSGTYSRFFLIPKAGRSDREPINGMAKQDAGAETPMAGRGQGGYKCAKCNRWKVSGNPCVCPEPEFVQQAFDRPKRANNHPTVKPTELMRHLVRLVTRPGGLVLDPFLGSGSTAVACEMEGFDCIGIEREEEYVRIAEARLDLVQRGLGLPDESAAVTPRPSRIARKGERKQAPSITVSMWDEEGSE
jgi:site-specific DNA-methyltransferase (adenine-specific)